MELDNLVTDKRYLPNLIPSSVPGQSLDVWCDPEALTPRDCRKIRALKADDAEEDAVMTMLEVMQLEWNLTKNGKPILPVKDAPSDQPDAYTLQDVKLKALVTILQAIIEAARPKETSTEPSLDG